jgi:hypothetical protein
VTALADGGNRVYENREFVRALSAHDVDSRRPAPADQPPCIYAYWLNSSEKKLARVLLLLSHFGKENQPEPAKISQETLAEMIGTTRSRVSFFMTLRLSNFEQTTKARSASFRVHTARETRPREPGKFSETILVVDDCNVRMLLKGLLETEKDIPCSWPPIQGP